jgi:hypothetical protein
VGLKFWRRRKKATKEQGLLLPTIERKNDPIGYLSAAIIVRDEAPYLEEWLAFHQLLGCEHFYIYDNGSIDNTAELLAPYVRDGRVTLTPWPRYEQAMRYQTLAFAHAICSYGADWRWMMFIDVDEFLFPVAGTSLVEALRGYEDIPAIAVPWRTFGFSGHTAPPAGLVLENYVMRSRYPTAPGSNKLLMRMKSIVDPCHVKWVKSPHIFGLDGEEWLAYNEEGRQLTSSNLQSLDLESQDLASDNILRLNHYITKSREEFVAKTDRGTANPHSYSSRRKASAVRRRRLDSRMKFADAIEADSVEDRAIQRFLPQLKSTLANRMSPK